jgi:hypothetical protein
MLPGLLVCRFVTLEISPSRAVPAGAEQAAVSLFRASEKRAKQEDHFGAKIREQLRKSGVKAPSPHLDAGDTEKKIKRFLHIGRFPRMWKEEWVGPANLDRASLRIDGMETYAIVAAVLLQVILGLYGAISEPDLDDPRIKFPVLQRIVFEAQMVLLMIAVLCSTYTMVVYLLIKIYAVTALGVYKDVAYRAFTVATGRHRSHAFWALIAAIITFLLAFALNLYSKVKGKRGLVLSIVATCLVYMVLMEGAGVLLSADKYIFGV